MLELLKVDVFKKYLFKTLNNYIHKTEFNLVPPFLVDTIINKNHLIFISAFVAKSIFNFHLGYSHKKNLTYTIHKKNTLNNLKNIPFSDPIRKLSLRRDLMN